MSFELKPDFELSRKRYQAFWEREIVDRPPVCFRFPVENPRPLPEKKHVDERARWLDIDYRAERSAAELENFKYLGDALPIAWPNMGPEIFSAWCGCGYEYGKSTTWTEPCIETWEDDGASARFDPDHPLFKATDAFTDRLLELSNGRFIVGLTDFHPGGDHIAALRDPAVLAMDLIEHPEEVKKKLISSSTEFLIAYEHFYEKLRAAEMPITSWAPLIHDGTFYIPSNDFSCMISPAMFQEFFLQGIIDECRYYERSIYHLDGPGALKHLDVLLDIPELDAVQWVPGAGNEGFTRWIEVYRRIQAAGKGIQILTVTVPELSLLFDQLEPGGIYVSHVSGVSTPEEAEAVLAKFERWE
jgi:hypothetical protein